MRKNVASQVIAFQMNSASAGTPVTSGTPTVFVTINGGTQATGSGASAHEGNGQWSYAPTQADTNGDHVAFTMALTNAISQTLNVYPVSFDPTDPVRMGQTALPNAAADASGGLPVSDAGGLDLDAMNTSATRLTAARAQVLDDWINSGRLDAILDSRMAEASISTTSGSVDLVTNVFNSVGITQAGADRVWLSTVRQLSANGLDLILVSSTFVFALIKGVWDRVLTGATHNINNSAGRKLRQVGVMVLTSGTAQAGSANTITLAATDSAIDDIYQGDRVTITGGTGQEEHGIITEYIGATRVATMSKSWTIVPDNTSEYELSVATVDVESWGHAPTTVSATTQKPEVDAASISDSTAGADAVEANISNLDSPISEMLDDGTAIYDRSSDSLQAIRDRGDAAWGGGGGGTSDWTVAEKENIRSALGVDGTKNAASGGQLQAIPTTPMRGTDGANTVVPLVAASTATQAKQDTAQDDLDALTGSDGVVLATLQPNYAPNTQIPLTAAEVNTEVDIALNTAIPGSPTAGSVNERVAAVDDVVSEARMSELDEATAGKMANQVDRIKAETDKIALVDAGAGATGSVIEEVENRPTTPMRGTDGANTTLPPTVTEITADIDASSAQLIAIKAKTDTMPIPIKRNTAFEKFPFIMVDSLDSPLTGLTVSVTRSIDGTAFGASANAPAEVANGGYTIDLAAEDLNGNTIIFRFAAVTAKDLFITVIPNP